MTSVTFSPDGKYVASGGLDGRVKLWDSSGAFIKDLVTQTEGVTSVAFSPVKEPLSLAVGLENGDCNILSVPESTAVSSAQRRAGKFDDKVRALAFSPDGETVASSGGFNGEISLWEADDGEPDKSKTLEGLGETVWNVGFAKDGNSIAFGTKHTSSQPNKYGPLEQVIRLRKARKSNSPEDAAPSRYRISFEDELDEPGDYLSARSESGGYKLTTRFGQTQTRVKGSETVEVPVREFRDLLVAKDGETQPRAPITRNYDEGRTFRSFTLTSDGSHFISGGERGYLAMYETEPGPGNRLKLVHRFSGHTNDVWAVALSADDQFLVSGSSDQTIKLWDVKSGFNILTIFVGKDEEWVAWNTAGYYTSSMAGDKYFGWQINRGPDQMPEFYSAAQFAKEYYRPDVIGEAFRAPDVKLAVTQADKWTLTQQTDALTAKVVDVRAILPPIVTINSPEKDQTEVQDRMLRLKLSAVSNTMPITELRVSLNGVPKGTFKGDVRRPDESKRIEVEMVVALAEGENKLFVVAENEGAVSKPQIRTIYYKPASVPEFDEFVQARQRNRGLGPRSVSHHPVREAVSIKPVPAVAAQPVPSPSPNDGANVRVVVDVQIPREDVTTVEDENLTISATAFASLKNQVELRVFLNNDPDPQHVVRSPTSQLAKLLDVQVTLRPGENIIRFVATDGEVSSPEEVRKVTFNPRVASKPNLIFLGIGISKYELFRPHLNFADKDAKAVADLLSAQKGEGRLFATVKVKLISDQEANREAIIEGLNWVKRETKFDNDVRVVLVSGHGGIFEDNYFFLSHKHNPEGDPETDSIRWNLFWDKLVRPNSNAFLFVDTCRAGKASKDFMRDPDQTGIFFFAASRAEETSLEDPQFGHGIFTQALLEGLRGERTLPGNRNADTNNDNQIDSKELQNFIEERVKALNKNQTPVIKPPTSLPNPIRLSTYPVPEP